jgi:chromosome segregation ATPase
MTASTEALAMIGLLPNGEKYRARLDELVAATQKAEAAIANAAAVEKSSADKLAVMETLLASLSAQADEITTANAEAAASRVAAENDLTKRASELEAAKVAHAAEVARSLEMFAAREAELNERQAALDADFATRAKDLHAVEGRFRAHHLGLRSIIAETRSAIATVS